MPPKPTLNYDAFNDLPQPFFWKTLGVVGTAVGIIGLYLMFVPVETQFFITYGVYIFSAGTVFACVGFVGNWWKKSSASETALSTFILQNNFLDEIGPIDNIPACLLGAGHDHGVRSGFRGVYKDVNFHASKYSFNTGSGRTETTHYFVVISFDIKQNFPLIVLDVEGNNNLGFSNLPDNIPGAKDLRLEGSFNRQYKLKIMHNTEREVLEFMTPDFMSELMKAPRKIDIEISGSKFFVVYGSDNFEKSNLHDLFETADIVLKHLGELSKSWQASISDEERRKIAQTALAPRMELLKRKDYLAYAWLATLALMYAMGYFLGGTKYAWTIFIPGIIVTLVWLVRMLLHK